MKTFRDDGTVVTVRQSYVRRAAIPESVAKDPKKLAEVLTRQQEDIQFLRSYGVKPQLEYIKTAPSSGQIVLPHQFGTPASWWFVDWIPSVSGMPILQRNTTSDENTLILDSYNGGTIRIRLEPSDGP